MERIFFVIGICFASFMDVLIVRLPLDQNVITGRSQCVSCHHQLNYLDLIPILNWYELNGRCRYCFKKFSFYHVFIELMGGFLAVYCYGVFQPMIYSLLICLFLMILYVIGVIDYRTMYINDSMLLFCLLIVILCIPFSNLSVIERLLGVLGASLPLYLINLIIKDSFGGGDIKFLAVTGFMLGLKNIIVVLILAIILAGIYAGSMMLMRQKNGNDYIAFGPFLCIAIVMIIFYEETIFKFLLYFYL